MTDDAAVPQSENPPASKKLGAPLIGLSVAWLLGACALAYSTHPGANTAATLSPADPIKIAETDADPAKPLMKAANAQTTSFPSGEASTSAVGQGQSFDFIVKFNNDHPDMDHCVKTFHKDEEAAKSIFREWAAQTDHLSDMSLKKVSYSGEMILTWTSDGDRPFSKSDVDAKLEKIKSMPSVRYADKDSQIVVQKGQ